MMWFACAVSWLAVAIAVIAAIYLTGSAWCLWTFLIPAMISWSSSNK